MHFMSLNGLKICTSESPSRGIPLMPKVYTTFWCKSKFVAAANYIDINKCFGVLFTEMFLFFPAYMNPNYSTALMLRSLHSLLHSRPSFSKTSHGDKAATQSVVVPGSSFLLDSRLRVDKGTAFDALERLDMLIFLCWHLLFNVLLVVPNNSGYGRLIF